MVEGEGMARPEIQISISDNASGSATRAGTGFDEWIQEVENKMHRPFTEQLERAMELKNKAGAKICKFTLLEEISRPIRLVTERELSQPSVVGIGPFHTEESTSISENKKWAIVRLMLMLYNFDLAACLYKMKDQVANARERYCDSDICKDDKSFAEMLLLDSCFILFVLTYKIRKTPSGYTLMQIASNPADKLELFRDDKTKFLDIISNKDEIAPDLLIIDNQIPFSVIEELFKELHLKKPLHEYALEFFEEIHPKSVQHYIDQSGPPNFLHLLDLFHWSRVPEKTYAVDSSQKKQPDYTDMDAVDSSQHKQPDSIGMDQKNPPKFSQLLHLFPWCRRFQKYAVDSSDNQSDIIRNNSNNPFRWYRIQKGQPDSIEWARHTPNATELRESATMIEKKTSGSSLDITFRGSRFTPIIRVLGIPELNIRDYSSLLFHNLIAFEMQSSIRGRCTMAFCTLMKNLLQSEEDVKLLRRRGILATSSMTDRKLVDLFESLSKLTTNHRMPRDLHTVCQQVYSHHKHPMSRFCGYIRLQYFPNPLVTLSVSAAGMIFLLTLLQTIYAMKYHN